MALDKTDFETSVQSTKEIAQKLRAFAKPDNKRGAKELLITIVPLLTLWNLMWLSLSLPYAVTILLGIPTAGFLMRLFVIQHDCGHGSFFESRTLNNIAGAIIGVFTFTPYDDWRQDHALHHAWAGNLDHRGFGDIVTLTVKEYRARDFWGRLRYRVFRNPLFLFTIFPLYQFLLRQRFPTVMSESWGPFISVMATNVAILMLMVIFASVVGWWELFLIQAPIIVFATALGVWLFFVQHQFEDTLWDRSDNWQVRHAAFHGSSFYDLPKPLMWLTGYIGAHHVHHVSSRIPSYELPNALEAIPELHEVPKLTLWESLRCANLALWDEEKRELIGFAGQPR